MTLEYAVCIERLSADDGGGYLATAPDLPGCMSDGETPEEALRNVQDAIASWIATGPRAGPGQFPHPTSPMTQSA